MDVYAGGIRMIHFTSTGSANSWLDANPLTKIVDIKFSSTESELDILIIYKVVR